MMKIFDVEFYELCKAVPKDWSYEDTRFVHVSAKNIEEAIEKVKKKEGDGLVWKEEDFDADKEKDVIVSYAKTIEIKSAAFSMETDY
jgi:ATP-dependent RNA circularization protein (DNA/RNA ligase family)